VKDRSIALAMPLTRLSEGLRLKAYLCPAGVATIGYGHTNGVRLRDTCTLAQAIAWLEEDLRDALVSVRRYVRVPLSPTQEAALIDFVFNLGESAFAHSTLLSLLNAGHYESVPAQLRRWNKGRVNGHMVELAGLTTRREAEVRLWLA
jgi:lysozyme